MTDRTTSPRQLQRAPLSVAALSVAATVAACSGSDLLPTLVVPDEVAVDASTSPTDDHAGHDAASGHEHGDAAGDDNLHLDLTFAATVGSEPFACGRSFAVGTPPTLVTPTDLRFYVSDVKLVAMDGAAVPFTLMTHPLWQLEDVALVDLEDGSGACAERGDTKTRSVVHGFLPQASYRGVELTLAVPLARDRAARAAAVPPLDLPSLFAAGEQGHAFVATGAQSVDDGTRRFDFRLWSTGCPGALDGGAGAPCDRPNRAVVRLVRSEAVDFAAARIVVDWGALLAGSDVAAPASDCRSEPTDPGCAPLFERLGLELGTGAAKASAAVFRLE